MCLFTTRTHRKQIYHRFFSSFFISIYFAFVLSFSVISFVKFLCLFSRISSAVPLIEENMGAESASSSSNSNCNSSSLQYGEDDISCKNNTSFVVLNVYDLTPINNYMYWFGFGIFHSGIEGTCWSDSWFVSTCFGFLLFQFFSHSCTNVPSSKRQSLFRSTNLVFSIISFLY